MEYIKGTPYFCCVAEKIKQYPYLDRDIDTEILIIGGGIEGAIANYYLSQNHDIILVDKSRLGHACTSCATALLEYQLDDFAEDLLGEMTEQEIVDSYKMGLYAIEKIENFIKKYGNKCEFSKRSTLMFSNKLLASKKIDKEFEFRQKHGFNCQLFKKENNPFPFEIKSGLYCENGGCEFNPYLFTKQMIENSKNQNKIFENTGIVKINRDRNKYIVETNFGQKIMCQKILIATGFNWELIDKNDLCERFVSYTIVTNPIAGFSWYDNALIQDSLDPYHYLRLLPDNRIIFGGEDTPFNQKLIDQNKSEKMYDKLYNQLINLFPKIKDKIKVDYSFCGLFGATDNNLGLIGKTEDENILYFFSCGANGIINAMFGVELIEDILSKKENNMEKLFSPLRIL